ncbi:MAG TPA: Crp/Fnr family transcriptional regulator [Pseudolabrys sp.]|nr:Crp/Fnr family transcriptional regulator [Pseudolabrys sp.]
MDRQLDLDILGRTEIFRGLSASALAEIRAAAVRKPLAAGDVLLQQDDPATTFYVIVSGRLRITQATADGQQVILRYLGSGEMAGYTALYGGANHPGTITALDVTELLAWNAATIAGFLAKYPAAALNAVAILGSRYHDMQVRLRELSTERVERRIAHTILRLAQQAGRRTARGIEIAFPLSRQDLAEMAGTTLHTVSRTLSGWEERGVIDSGRRRVIVRDTPALMEIAEDDAQ